MKVHRMRPASGRAVDSRSMRALSVFAVMFLSGCLAGGIGTSHAPPESISSISGATLTLTVFLHGGNVDKVSVSGEVVYWIDGGSKNRASMKSHKLNTETLELRADIGPFESDQGSTFHYYFEYFIDGQQYTRGSVAQPFVIPVGDQ